MPAPLMLSDGTVRRKDGNARPSLSVGLTDDGLMMGTFKPPATWAAIEDADEHPAPMMALTPEPPNAYCVKCRVACSACVGSHLESLKANCSCVSGRRWSATPSLLSLSSCSAWYTPTRGAQLMGL
eukprot:6218972-Prymnesium_polylepis.3